MKSKRGSSETLRGTFIFSKNNEKNFRKDFPAKEMTKIDVIQSNEALDSLERILEYVFEEWG